MSATRTLSLPPAPPPASCSWPCTWRPARALPPCRSSCYCCAPEPCPPPCPLQLALHLEASQGPAAVSQQLLLLCINEEQVEATTKDLLAHRFYGWVGGWMGGWAKGSCPGSGLLLRWA